MADDYNLHSVNASLARWSPNGRFLCSGGRGVTKEVRLIGLIDESGQVKIWEPMQAETKAKYEYKVLSGKINDLCWDFESSRILVVGDGREK